MAKAPFFDAAEYLDSREMIAAYLTEALESEDAAIITRAVDAIARADEKSGLVRGTQQ